MEQTNNFSDVKYIYNILQADYYIQKGCMPLGIGRHIQTGNVYVVFSHSGTSKVYSEWCEQCKEYKNSKIQNK